MQINDISKNSGIIQQYLTELRDINVQKERRRFRDNIERIGAFLGYEMSKTLPYESYPILSPLAKAVGFKTTQPIVVCSVLRAGLTLHQGLLSCFTEAESAFIAAYRAHSDDKNFTIKIDYRAAPKLDGKTLILADPMLATGQTFLAALEALKPLGKPKNVHLISVIGSASGVKKLSEELMGQPIQLWISTIDKDLNDFGYIVPGLGDAGDLSYGEKY
ncbi:MAG: uracil phosphoribosyltransferase [Flavobacteriaceae bacterium]|nr:uracil phosphoribosyltransferase [Flavobacteriaceae bacterium]